MPNVALPLHILSVLCQLHTSRAQLSRLADWLPSWQQQLQQEHGSELTPRQLRRWRLLYSYWQNQQELLIQHALRRGHLTAELALSLRELGPLVPPAQPEFTGDPATACTALFITAFAWNENYGECQALDIRQVKYLDRFPPLHLSARVADASILSAGNLALEALSQWFRQRLALEEPVPIWTEAAFPDSVRLVDESASLAFVAGVMQWIFDFKQPAHAFSGIVRRDSGQIEPVQGFDLAYGKLEAAFDAGVRELFVPHGTSLNALPAAGIRLHKQSEDHYSYAFDDQPQDQMQIYLLKDLSELFSAAFLRHAPQMLQQRLENLPLNLAGSQTALPALAHWQSLTHKLQPLLAPGLKAGWQRLSRQYQQAYEFARAGLNTNWSEVAQSLKQFICQLLALITNSLASVALENSSPQQQQALLKALQDLTYPLALQDWLRLLEDPSLNHCLEALLPELSAPLGLLSGFAQQLEKQPAQDGPPLELWAQLRFLLSRQLLEELLSKLSWQRLTQPDGSSQSCLVSSGQSWKLSLVDLQEIPAQGLWVYAGMQQQHPTYLELGTAQSELRPGASPYFPQQPLSLERHFNPLYLRTQEGLFYGLETLAVSIRLSNLSYLTITEIDCQQSLPAGLSLHAGELNWHGQLAPMQSICFEYRLQPEKAASYLLPSPELSYQLPAPYHHQQQPLNCEQQLIFESHSQAKIELSYQLPEKLFTRQTEQLVIELRNTSSLKASKLEWHSALLPAGFRLVQTAALPEEIPPFSTRLLELSFSAQQPGRCEWPELVLNYRGPDNQLLSARDPGQQLEVYFKRELPLKAWAAESERLTSCFETQNLQGVYLWGEAGLGKRQLLQAWKPVSLSAELQGDPFLDLPLQAARQLIRQLLNQVLSSQLRLPDTLEPSLELLQAFAQSRLSSPETDLQFKARFFQAVLQLFDALTLLEPVLIRIYNVQQLDQASLELLRFLLLNQARVFLALSAQTPDLPAPLNDLALARIPLKRLTQPQIQLTLDALFETNQFPASLSHDLLARTQGLALYLQEYLAWLVQQGWIKWQDSSWQLEQPALELPIPEQLEQLILKEFQPLLQQSALLSCLIVAGQSLSRQTFLQLAQTLPGSPLDQANAFCEQALASGLLKQQAQQLSFAQPLYYQLLQRQLEQQDAPLLRYLHAQAAGYFEQLEAEPQIIAQHWLQSDQKSRALDYCLRLGEQAWRQGSLLAASQWLQQAEKLLSPSSAQNLQLYRLLGAVSRQNEHRDLARGYYQRMLQLAQELMQPAEQAWAWLGLASLAEQQEALHCLQQAQALAQPLAEPELLYQVCLDLGSYLSAARSFDEGQVYLYQALGYASPESVKQAEVLEIMGFEAIKAGQTQMAENYLLQSKTLYQAHASLTGLASVYNRLGACCFYQQELQRAQYYFSESRKYCQQNGNLLRLTHVNHNLGLLAEALRDYQQAQRIFRENFNLAGQLGDLRVQGFACNQLGSIALKLGRLAEADASLKEAQDLLVRATDQRGMAHVRMNQGLLALLQDKPHEAEGLLLSAQTSFDELHDIMGQDQVILRLGHCAWLKRDYPLAQSYYERCLASRQQLDQKGQDGLERVYQALGLTAFQLGDWPLASSYLLKSEALFEARREIRQFAIASHNLMCLYQQLADPEQAQAYQQKRDILIGIDPDGLSSQLQGLAEICPILD